MIVPEESRRLPTQAAAYRRDGFVLVPDPVAAWLHRRLPLNQARINARMDDLLVDAVLLALLEAAIGSGSSSTTMVASESAAPEVWDQQVTIQEAMQMTGLSRQALTRACREGRLPAHSFGGRWVVTRADLAEYTRRRRLPTHSRRTHVDHT